MKKSYLLILLLTAALYSNGQSLNKVINTAEVQRIESVLSADSMQGRKTFTKGADKAAYFISNEFKKIGLTPFKGITGYKQTFTMVSSKISGVSASIDGSVVDAKNIIAVSSSAELTITEQSGFLKAFIKEGAQFRQEVGKYLTLKENAIVFVDPSFAQNFIRLNRSRQQLFKSDKSVVFVLGNFDAQKFDIQVKQELTEQQAANVVGVIPGKGKPDEIVVFSGHYDHLGIGKADGSDSIYNGANDDASGITAIIELAKYYKAAKSNERTLLFAAFAGEEIGGYGSQYFSKQLNPDQVIAMFNMEMIGTESKWGKNSAYITGFEKTDLGKILQKNLQGSTFSFYPDPYIDQNLFYRSDNATLARLGVPAHTISTSKMDTEPNYHRLTDEVGTLDLTNMTAIIKSVIISAKSIVDGRDTPSRVKADELTR
ncbi:MAG: M20/M25/M40 family metallo-hydrolase [Bacteroidota bacterium]|nr:M20/M25/M40 family metallo-hydrolase [Bacteroidota bacterium]